MVGQIQWLNNLRALATFAVIVLHVSYEILPLYGKISNYVWWSGNIFDGATRFCVPLFVMLSGSLLIPKIEGLSTFLHKRLSKILVPFFFWSIVYMIANIFFDYIQGTVFSLDGLLIEISRQIRFGSAGHLWYIYMIIGIYLFIPVIGKWARNSNDNEIKYFLLIWFVTLFFAFPVFNDWKINVDLSNFAGYIGYATLGYYLSRTTNIDPKLSRIWGAVLIILGIFVTTIGTYYFTRLQGHFVSTFYNYLSPNVCIVSAGLFLLLKNFIITNKLFLRIINLTSKFSYGIYLIHILVLISLKQLGLNWAVANPLVSVPLISFLCIFISGTLISLINKIPFGKYISG